MRMGSTDVPITKVTLFRTSDGAIWPSLEAAGQHEQSLKLLAWFEARVPVAEARPLLDQLLKDYVLTPRKGWIA